jgi:hypothetical protein
MHRALFYLCRGLNFFIFIFIAIVQNILCKIYGQPQILQKYTSAAVAHSVRDVTTWSTAVRAARSGPLAWARLGAIRHGVKCLAPWVTMLGPSVVRHGSSRPANAVAHDAMRKVKYPRCTQ